MVFSYIKGIPEYAGEDYIVIENNNIGFEIKTSGTAISRLSDRDEEVMLYTYMHVREDDMTLYGFPTREELEVFKLLIAISGVGPKAALAILTVLSVEELNMAVISEDAKTISKANGVGMKTAQRIIMELKDKLNLKVLYESFENEDNIQGDRAGGTDPVREVVMALEALGYSGTESMRAVKRVENYKKLDEQALLKEALNRIYS